MGVPQPHRLFVPCAPGLEPWLLAEIRAVGGVRPRAVGGGVELEANDHVLARTLLEVGLGLDVRARLGAFPAHYFDAIARGTAALPWGRFVGPGQTVEIRAAARRSKLLHTGAIEERVLEGIKKVVGSLATDDPDPWRVYARLERDQLSLSISLAGEPLHRRGYRLQTGKAPLREDLARGLLAVAGWSPDEAFVDLFCGSGTLAIEAARWACARPPGWDRGFHWTRAPTFDAERWAKVRKSLESRIRSSAPKEIRASDRDAGAVAAARANAERAGVGGAISFSESALGAAELSGMAGPGLWLSNPPFGTRVRGGGLRSLYQSIGHRFRELPVGWRLGLLVDDPKLAHGTGLDLKSRVLLDHGGKKVRLYTTGEDDDAG